MWFHVIVVMILHLFFSGVLCLVIDEINKDYTAPFFMTYMTALAASSIHNYYVLLAGLIHDRENTLELLDESLKEEE